VIKNKRLEIHWSTLIYRPLRTSEGHFSPATAAKVESLVTDILTDILIHFPIIAQCSKGVHYFHRVVGLVVNNIHQWVEHNLLSGSINNNKCA